MRFTRIFPTGNAHVKNGIVHLKGGNVHVNNGIVHLKDGNVHVKNGIVLLKDGNVRVKGGNVYLKNIYDYFYNGTDFEKKGIDCLISNTPK